MKPKLKLQYTDFWKDFDPYQNLFTSLLKNRYDVEISDEPDILIYSVYDFHHIQYGCPKVFYTAENVRPNFHECDFSITFDRNTYGGKNFRMPLYRFRGDLKDLCEPKNPEIISKEKTKFCCMVVSNDKGDERNEFFRLLNHYKKVDSGGKYLNNVGGLVADKMEIIKDYKFVLSFENASYPGYTTEKIVEPMLARSIPIYWGNPVIGKEFNTSSFVNVHDYSTYEKALEQIIRIDNDESLYHSYIKEPFYNNNTFPVNLEFSMIEQHLANAIENLLSRKPVSKSIIYKPRVGINKFRKKLLSRLNGKPHFYY